MFNASQCAFITLPLNRLIVKTQDIVALVVLKILPKSQSFKNQSSFLEQISYLRLLRMLGCGLSIKETANNFWSSSPVSNNANNAWQLNFNHGNDNNNNRNNSNRVRLVRPRV